MKPVNAILIILVAAALLFTAGAKAADKERYGEQQVVSHVNPDIH